MAEVNRNNTAEAATTKAAKATTQAATQATETTARAATRATETYAAAANETLDKFDMAVPEALRSAAENAVNQSRDAYERSKDAMEGTVEMLEQSIDKAGEGSAAINRKMIDMFQTNLNSGFDLARDLAGARNVGEIFERQAAFARQQFETFSAQAKEMSELSTRIATETTEPFRSQMSRSMETVKAH